jgi:hypothetical protein
MDVILVGVTQTLGTLSRNSENFAAAHYSNSLKPERFLKKGSAFGRPLRDLRWRW